jgi:hypothetical protein
MIKKSVLAAGLAALAFAALPAIASATYPNPYLAENGNPVSNTAFSVGTDPLSAGEPDHEPYLETKDGNWVRCKKVEGSGEFETAETGSIKLKFIGCHTKLNLKCGTGEASSETIETTELPFHLKTVDHEGVQTPGVLITPNGHTAHGAHFATFQCQIVGKIEVGGNESEEPYAGIIGTITAPKKEVPSNTATLSFKQTEGVQTHRVVTNDNEETVEYDLKSSIGGGATQTAGETATGTITFANGMKPEILTTP